MKLRFLLFAILICHVQFSAHAMIVNVIPRDCADQISTSLVHFKADNVSVLKPDLNGNQRILTPNYDITIQKTSMSFASKFLIGLLSYGLIGATVLEFRNLDNATMELIALAAIAITAGLD